MSLASLLPTFSVGCWTGTIGEEGKTIAWPLENSTDRPFPFDVFNSSGVSGCNGDTRFVPLDENSTDFLGFSHFLEDKVVATPCSDSVSAGRDSDLLLSRLRGALPCDLQQDSNFDQGKVEAIYLGGENSTEEEKTVEA